MLSKKVLFPVVGIAFTGALLFSFLKDRIGCVGGFPVFQKTKKDDVAQKIEEIPTPVKVYKIAKVSFRDTLPSLGTMKGFREIDLRFAVSGTIEYVNFKEGERITQGDIIASLDQKEALLKLEYAKMELDKQTKLLELGSTVEIKAKQSQLEYQSAKAEFDKTNLVALSDGYIGTIAVDKGSFVQPNDKIGTFVDVKDVYVEFGVIEKDVSKIKEGQNMESTVESFPDQVFKGQVDSVSPLVEGRSRTVQVRAKISNVDEKIKPGMFGRVNVLVYEKDQALVIPSSSFKKKDDQYLVYLVHPEEPKAKDAGTDTKTPEKKKGFTLPFFGKAGTQKSSGSIPAQPLPEETPSTFGVIEIRPIEIAYATPDAVEIKEGVDEGDLVIMELEQDLQDKARVEITETQEGIF